MHGHSCRQYIFWSCNIYFQCYAFWLRSFHMPVWKRKRLKGFKFHTFMGYFQIWQWSMLHNQHASQPALPLSPKPLYGLCAGTCALLMGQSCLFCWYRNLCRWYCQLLAVCWTLRHLLLPSWVTSCSYCFHLTVEPLYNKAAGTIMVLILKGTSRLMFESKIMSKAFKLVIITVCLVYY